MPLVPAHGLTWRLNHRWAWAINVSSRNFIDLSFLLEAAATYGRRTRLPTKSLPAHEEAGDLSSRFIDTPMAGRAEAQRQLIEFFSKSADADALLALLVLRPNGIQMIHGVTTDPAVLIEAVRKTRMSATSRDSPTLKYQRRRRQRRRSPACNSWYGSGNKNR